MYNVSEIIRKAINCISSQTKKLNFRLKNYNESPQSVESNLNDLSKKRKRIGSLTPKSIEILNEAYKKNKNPTSKFNY